MEQMAGRRSGKSKQIGQGTGNKVRERDQGTVKRIREREQVIKGCMEHGTEDGCSTTYLSLWYQAWYRFFKTL